MSNKINKEQIEKLLPHREPMLLIDSLINIVPLKSATAIVKVKKGKFFFDGHFPGQPVMPGVLIVEAFGQAAAALTARGLHAPEHEPIEAGAHVSRHVGIVLLGGRDLRPRLVGRDRFRLVGHRPARRAVAAAVRVPRRPRALGVVVAAGLGCQRAG